MRIQRFKHALMAGLILLVTASCSGGGGSDPSNGGGVGGSGITFGKITGFGSVFVNGVEYETTNATITLDGIPGSETDLQIGMLVTIQGEVDSDGITGTAENIEFEDNLEGPIQSIDLATLTFIVLEHTVIVNDETVFNEEVSLLTLTVDNIVEVSGFFDASGAIRATHIRLVETDFTPGVHEIEVKGTISTLDPIEMTFTLGDLMVDYTEAVLENIPGNELVNDLFVEVKSTREIINGVLFASAVIGKEHDLPEDEGEWVELEGLINSVISSTDFEVNHHRVRINTDTVFKNGTEADIALDVRVEVEGRWNADGVLIAHEIEFHPIVSIEIEADVQSVELEHDTFTILGLEIIVNAHTEVRDESDEELHTFNLEHIQAGDRLEVRGHLNEEGGIVASRLERTDPEDTVSLQGPVDEVAVDALSLVILGITIETTGETEFENIHDETISVDTFFAEVRLDDLVKAEGMFIEDSAMILAEEVEFEE